MTIKTLIVLLVLVVLCERSSIQDQMRNKIMVFFVKMHSFFYLADYFLKENFLFFLCFKEQNNTTYTFGARGAKKKL